MGKVKSKKIPLEKRMGDSIFIKGDYQFKAFYSANTIQRFWHQSKSRLIQSLMPPGNGENVLDVGCGSGVITNLLGNLGANAMGVDGNPSAISFASQTYVHPHVKFFMGLVDEEFILPEPVDKIYCLEVIEHIYYFQGKCMLEAFYKSLKSGGLVFLTTPNYLSFWPVIERVFDLFQVTPKMSGEQHVEFYNLNKLDKLCRDTGFSVTRSFTTNFLAPWMSPLSWNMAVALENLEIKLRCPIGSTLVFILTKN
jgi:2-polyprenyl-3-methyl-5-hydroxy-6-metoxy-1,4-benzoquinol methylase